MTGPANLRDFVIAIFVAVWVTAFGGSLAAEPLRYEPAIVQLSGILVLEDHYGPPNYGETPDRDLKLKVPVLKLDALVDVTASQNDDVNADSFTGIQRVQLLGSPPLKLVELAGQRVMLEGTLFEKHTGWHVTDVVMTVLKASPTEK